MKKIVIILFVFIYTIGYGQSPIVGGNGHCVTQGDPNLNSKFNNPTSKYTCYVIYDETNNIWYLFDNTKAAGSKYQQVSITSETKVLSSLPTTPQVKFGDFVEIQTATDTTIAKYIKLNTYKTLSIKSSLTPSLYITSGTQVFDNTEAIWFRPLSLVTTNYTRFVVKNKTWKPEYDLTIEDFGADSLSIDNTLAIQRAIDSSYLNNFKVFVPKGIFITNKVTVNVSNPFLMYGVGTLKLINGANQTLIRVQSSYATIEGLTLDGNRANQTITVSTPGRDSLGAVIYSTSGCDYFKVERCNISQAVRNGISGYGFNFGHIYKDNVILDGNFIGIQPSQGSNLTVKNMLCTGNIIKRWTQDGIGTVGQINGIISHNIIYDCYIAGISLEAHCDSMLVFGNIYHNTPGFVNQKFLQCNDIVNSKFYDNHGYGAGALINIAGGDQSHDIVVTNNTCDSCGRFNATTILITGAEAQAGAYDNAYKYRLVVTNNTITNNRLNAIQINSVQGVLVKDNYIRGINLDRDTATTRYFCGIAIRAFANRNTIEGNTVDGGSTAFHNFGIVEVNEGSEAPSNNVILNNDIKNVLFDIQIIKHNANQSIVRRYITKSTPLNGTYYKNDKIEKAVMGTSLTDLINTTTEGTLGSATTQGSVTAGGSIMTVVKADSFITNQFIRIVGAANAGADLITQINNINHATNQITLQTPASLTVTDASVTLNQPVFQYMNSTEQTGSIAYNTLISGGTTSGDIDISVSGAIVGDVFSCTLGVNDLPTGVIIKSVRVKTNNTVSVVLQNISAGNLTPNVVLYVKK